MDTTKDDLNQWKTALTNSGISQRNYGVYMGVDFNKAMTDAINQMYPLPTPQKPKSMHDVASAEKAGKDYVKKVNRDSKFGIGTIQEKDFIRGIKWMMEVYFSKNSILVWKKFSEGEPSEGATILSRYLKDHVYDYSLMKYGDNDFKRSVLLSVDAEWSVVEATNYWYSLPADFKVDNAGILSQISSMP